MPFTSLTTPPPPPPKKKSSLPHGFLATNEKQNAIHPTNKLQHA